MITVKQFVKNILFLFWKKFRSNKDQEYLFLMGLPRSGSSLVMHILCSNSDIIGAGEYFTKYQNKEDLIKSEFDIRRKSNHLFKNNKYVANQILHSSRTPNHEILLESNIKFIFLIRNPMDTLSSMYHISKKNDPSITKTNLVDLYIDRMNDLKDLANHLDKNKWFFITYEDLLDQSVDILSDLSEFLKLEGPLSASYTDQRFSQVSGDPSENIKRGYIFKTHSEKVAFEEHILNKAFKTYQDSLKFFTDQSAE